ncbi:hypothetical protein [Allochromatium vinosum]|uniref:Uncharacterized protein n=1 Tax=Allochromatium vinosum (strain ATCC 17899 / DSM 180 / NBRC 103801 / NCIMB 10441 / D) TaxID=572477 RepID=D3RUV2_ALLVD|nr:hypothetical protein [Allochromatium vinosum]ADC61001.1 hypothetical protein Alvin_0029 [Allochromatium vinosum DSM 180]
MRERIHPPNRHGIRDGRLAHIHVQRATAARHDPGGPDGWRSVRRLISDLPADAGV